MGSKALKQRVILDDINNRCRTTQFEYVYHVWKKRFIDLYNTLVGNL